MLLSHCVTFIITGAVAQQAHDIPKVLRLPAQTVRDGSYTPLSARRAHTPAEPEPGDLAPELAMATLGGGKVSLAEIQPAVFNILDSNSLFSAALWGLPTSVDGLLAQSPRLSSTHFVFASW